MNGLSYFKELAQKAKSTTNSKEAQEIKKKLITIGTIMTVLGFVGVFICFVSFTLGGISMVNNHTFGFSVGVLIPFFLIIPCAAIGSVGSVILKLGLGIVVAKATANFIDTNRYCPNCGDVITENEKFCSKCGKPLLINKVCKKCNTNNDIDAKYCINCGNKLED